MVFSKTVSTNLCPGGVGQKITKYESVINYSFTQLFWLIILYASFVEKQGSLTEKSIYFKFIQINNVWWHILMLTKSFNVYRLKWSDSMQEIHNKDEISMPHSLTLLWTGIDLMMISCPWSVPELHIVTMPWVRYRTTWIDLKSFG